MNERSHTVCDVSGHADYASQSQGEYLRGNHIRISPFFLGSGGRGITYEDETFIVIIDETFIIHETKRLLLS